MADPTTRRPTRRRHRVALTVGDATYTLRVVHGRLFVDGQERDYHVHDPSRTITVPDTLSDELFGWAVLDVIRSLTLDPPKPRPVGRPRRA